MAPTAMTAAGSRRVGLDPIDQHVQHVQHEESRRGEIFKRNRIEVKQYLEHDDRVVLPVGSTEQHRGNAPALGPIRKWSSVPRPHSVEVLFRSYKSPRPVTAAPDGSHAGAYARPDANMQIDWEAGVAEVRDLVESGWSKP